MKKIACVLRRVADRLDAPLATVGVQVQIQPVLMVSGIDSDNVNEVVKALQAIESRRNPFSASHSGLC